MPRAQGGPINKHVKICVQGLDQKNIGDVSGEIQDFCEYMRTIRHAKLLKTHTSSDCTSPVHLVGKIVK